MTSEQPPPTAHISIRMTKCPDRTLNGYVFADMEHARRWLSQPFVRAEDVNLQRVEIGETHRCTRCGGSGVTGPKITILEPISLKEALA